jgi:hypothetical protein
LYALQEQMNDLEEACLICGDTVVRSALKEEGGADAWAAKLSSAKLDHVRELARAARHDAEKLLVFSQWTSTLDLLEHALDTDGISFCRSARPDLFSGAGLQLLVCSGLICRSRMTYHAACWGICHLQSQKSRIFPREEGVMACADVALWALGTGWMGR